MKEGHASPRRTAVLVIAFLLGATVLGILVWRRYQQSLTPPPAPIVQPLASKRVVALFFATPDADGLVREGREIDPCDDQTACLQAVVQELQNGPVGDFEATLPDAAPLPTVAVHGDTAIVDLSAELIRELPGGSAAELATVYALVNTITVNFSQVRRVQLLIEGKPATTLKGHVDITAPLTQDLSMERRIETTPSAGTPPGSAGAKP
jgi:spore germination protein GerM